MWLNTFDHVAQDVYEPELWRVIPYLLCISLIGIFILLQLRKRFIVDYALPYPSGTASGVLINSLHKIGDKTAGRQVPTNHCPCESWLQMCPTWSYEVLLCSVANCKSRRKVLSAQRILSDMHDCGAADANTVHMGVLFFWLLLLQVVL